MYQVLFTIEYKNKIFTIFNTTYNRKTFLELNDKGEYIYPTLEDFMELHDIYNSKKEVLYDIKLFNKKKRYIIAPLKPKTKVTFKEAVRNAASHTTGIVLCGVLVSGIIASICNLEFVLTQENDTIKITTQVKSEAYIDDTEKLNEILGYKEVSKETIIEAINTNEKIPDSYKDDAIKLLEYLTNKYPECDMRIYYENIKRMKIVENGPHKYLGGQFTPRTGIIKLYSGRSNSTPTHELGHASHHIELGIIYPIYRAENFGFFLDEAYTNKITAGIYGTVSSYFQEGKVLDYFLSCVPYTYYDYERFGIQRLITMLEEKYPNVDINYIIESMDAITNTLFNEAPTPEIEEIEQLMDTFFDICINNIDVNGRELYKPFENFIRLIDYEKYPELVSKYFNYYNNILLEKGVSKEVLLETSDSLIENIRQNQKVKTSFREYLTTIDKESIKEDDLYETFRKFAEEYNLRWVKVEDVLDILDIYNDFLYCNGFNAKQTINREDIEGKVSNYQYIIGVVVDEEGVIYPFLENDYENSTYDIIDEDGKIIKKEIKHPQQITIFNNFLAKTEMLLENFGKNQLGSQDFWYDFFKLPQIKFKKIPIYLNGELACEKQLMDVNLQICQTKDGGIGFILSDGLAIDQDGNPHRVGEVYYESPNIVGDPVQAPSIYMGNYIEFLGNLTHRKSIELSEILNEEYLKNAVIKTSPNAMCSSNVFHILFYNSNTDAVEIHPDYQICMERYIAMENIGNTLCYSSLRECYFYNGVVYFGKYTISDNIGVSYEESQNTSGDSESNDTTKIYFEEVLRYYGLLNPEIETYEFTDDEMCDLYKQYILEFNEKNISQPIRHGR